MMKKKISVFLLAVLALSQPCMAMKSSRSLVTQDSYDNNECMCADDNIIVIDFSDLSDSSDDPYIPQKSIQSTYNSAELFNLPEGSTLETYKSQLKNFDPPALGFNLNQNSTVKEGYISEDTFNFILDKFLEKCPRDPSKLFDEYKLPEKNIILVGDLHGNVQSVKNILLKYLEEDNIIVFLGDFTDRGPNSVETISLLLHAKTLFTDNIFLLRGNHEDLENQLGWSYYQESSPYPDMFSHCKQSANSLTLRSQVNSIYKNLETCLKKIIKIYDSLPLGLVFDNEQQRIFCCHGCIHPIMNQKNGLLKLQKEIDNIAEEEQFFEEIIPSSSKTVSNDDDYDDDNDPYKQKIKELKHDILWNRFNDTPSNPAIALSISDIDNFNKHNSFTFSCFGHVHKNQVTYSEDGKIVGISLLSSPNYYKLYADTFDSDSNLAGMLKINGKSATLEFISFDASFNTESENVPIEIQNDKNEVSALQLPSFKETFVFDTESN